MQTLLKPLLTCRSRGIERRKGIVYTCCTDAAIGGQTTLLTRRLNSHIQSPHIYRVHSPLAKLPLSRILHNRKLFCCRCFNVTFWYQKHIFFFLSRSICFRRNVRLREFRISVKRKNGSLGSFSFCNKKQTNPRVQLFCLVFFEDQGLRDWL